ncbi:hypothetical protein BCR35DRAFT_301974 [Leucosporidium creatinivorum]|uniref:Uncharacterized protein n=1 Tax=Leucosporidium creatinivorum TaxID=106004 RepID=A0A1Y2FVN6_9BASI|nr:hypothetical protein BCR35DRAFT_301974 [Leucosporidium creatinivorum]
MQISNLGAHSSTSKRTTSYQNLVVPKKLALQVPLATFGCSCSSSSSSRSGSLIVEPAACIASTSLAPLPTVPAVAAYPPPTPPLVLRDPLLDLPSPRTLPTASPTPRPAIEVGTP